MWDHPWPGKALEVDGFEFVYELENPAAFRGLTWYFRSGPGWYAAALPVRDGRIRMWVPRDAFEALDSPAGWNEVRAVRMSPWTARRGSGAVVLLGVFPRRAEVGVVMPGDGSSPDPGERAFGRRAADAWVQDLSSIGLFPLRVEESTLARVDAARLKALILPYNPRPSSEMLDALERYVKAGGRLVVCYNADARLANIVGVLPGRWVAADLPGRWQSMRFPDEAWGGPASVPLASAPNLLTVQLPTNGPARALAVWEDVRGARQPEIAIATTPRGAWFSYLPGGAEDAARARLFAFLLVPYIPDAPARAVERLAESVRARAVAGGAAADELARATNLLAAGDVSTAWDAVEQARRLADLELAARVGWPDGLALGIWDHTGKGLYAGDWARTMAELAECGFSDLFVYVARDAPRPTAAAQAAAPHGIRVHAWHACFNHDGSAADRARAMQTPDRLQRAASGARAFWLCPSREENRRVERERLIRLAGTPGIAGIQLDYIRYPDAEHCYCAHCRDAFAAYRGAPVANWPGDVREGEARRAFLDWRAAQVTALVRETAEAVRTAHPGVRLSAAVWPEVDRVGDELGQQWGRWMEAGWLDFVAPMSYTERVGELAAWTRRHAAVPGAAGKVWAGLGVTSSHTRLTPEQALLQARAAREAGATGVVIFDMNPTVQAELFPVLRRIRAERQHD